MSRMFFAYYHCKMLLVRSYPLRYAMKKPLAILAVVLSLAAIPFLARAPLTPTHASSLSSSLPDGS